MDFVDLFSLELWFRSLRGGVHVSTAVLALVLGPVVLLRRKGDQLHRVLGRIWFGAMLTVNLSAFTMYGFNGLPNLFHGFALLSLSALLPGFFAARTYAHSRAPTDLQRHMICMHWAYFGLASAGLWQLISHVAILNGGFQFATTLWILIGLTGLASWLFGRWLARRFPTPAPS